MEFCEVNQGLWFGLAISLASEVIHTVSLLLTEVKLILMEVYFFSKIINQALCHQINSFNS